ncbi:MAG TPA: rhodanese-like domain-containing protein [Beijerinckiaceae bacterium]|nr:rhodanese-like domain-containing protein [Beijerinckiaceae bacterium]
MNAIREVSRSEVKAGMADGSLVLVDVREDHEFAAGHVPGSVSAPLSRLSAADLAPFKDKRIVFSCAAGVRSQHAIAVVQAEGLSLNEHYRGGFRDWVMAGEAIRAG